VVIAGTRRPSSSEDHYITSLFCRRPAVHIGRSCPVRVDIQLFTSSVHPRVSRRGRIHGEKRKRGRHRGSTAAMRPAAIASPPHTTSTTTTHRLASERACVRVCVCVWPDHPGSSRPEEPRRCSIARSTTDRPTPRRAAEEKYRRAGPPGRPPGCSSDSEDVRRHRLQATRQSSLAAAATSPIIIIITARLALSSCIQPLNPLTPSRSPCQLAVFLIRLQRH